MNKPFDSPLYLLSRAKEYVAGLERKIDRSFDTKPYTTVIEPDSDGINQLHKIKLSKPLPKDFAATTREICTTLRAVLDQVGYAVARTQSAKELTKGTSFPFGDTLAQLNNNVRSTCKNIPQDIVTLFCSFKPYKGGDDLLWALNRIRNTNEHRMLVAVGIVCGGTYIDHMEVVKGPLAIPFPKWDSANQEVMYAVTGPQTRIKYNINLSFDVSFNEVEVVKGQPVLDVLNYLVGKVESILLATEAEVKRLGYI